MGARSHLSPEILTLHVWWGLLVTNFIEIGQGDFELQGSKNWGLPLTWHVALTTVQHYRSDCYSDH